MDLVYRLPTRLSGPTGQVGLALSLPPPFRLSSSLSLCSSLCLQSSLCLAQFSSDSCLSGLVLFASLVRFTLAISNAAPYRFPQELLHLVTIPGRPPFSSSSCLHHSPQLGATSGRTLWNPRLSSGVLVTPCRALCPLGSQISSLRLWIAFSALPAVSPIRRDGNRSTPLALRRDFVSSPF